MTVEDGGWFSGSGGQKRAYLCVAKGRLFFVRPNFSKVIQGIGVLEYKHIESIVQDKGSSVYVQFVLSSNRPPELPASILVSSEIRSELVNHISICYLADSMHRLQRVSPLPLVENDLFQTSEVDRVLPFKEFRLEEFHDYCFFIRDSFELVEDTVGKAGVSYVVPLEVPKGADVKKSSEVPKRATLSVYRYGPIHLSKLSSIGREHIRWVAMEYKQAMVQDNAYVLKDSLYQKKMNLSNDVSTWVCWELLVREPSKVTAVVLLRRQYVPPLMDLVQDFAIIVEFPIQEEASNKQVRRPERKEGDREIPATHVDEEKCLHEAELVADTFGPLAQSPSIYQDLVQARLDALLYVEESYGWIRTRLRLKPEGESQIEKYASIFVRGVIKILRDENALSNPGIWKPVCERVEALSENSEEANLKPMVVALEVLGAPAELAYTGGGSPAVNHSWCAKVSKYLAFCLDGGLFGMSLTIADVITTLANKAVSQEAGEELLSVVGFLLHLRHHDLNRPWEKRELRQQLVSCGLLASSRADADVPGTAGGNVAGSGSWEGLRWTFNDRVMQVLIEVGYLQKLFCPGSEPNSIEYASLLNCLMLCPAASVNLRASICRWIVSSTATECDVMLCPGLIHLMQTGGAFLATYATAALVNLSQAKEVVKSFVIDIGVGKVCMAQLSSNEDDLIQYTLMLLVSLTKYINHRKVLISEGVLPVLMRLFTSWHDVVHVAPSKRRILAETCSVLGQMCNDEESRRVAGAFKPDLLQTLLTAFGSVIAAATKVSMTFDEKFIRLHAKIMFALKQLCQGNVGGGTRRKVGHVVIVPIMERMRSDRNLLNSENKDWVLNALMLLMVIVINVEMANRLRDAGWENVHPILLRSELGKLIILTEKIHRIQEYVKKSESLDVVISPR